MERKVEARVRAQRWYLRFPRGVPVSIFLLVSAITALSVYAIERVETQRADAQHRQMAVAVTAAIERLANANVVYLRAGAQLFGNGRADARVFQEFGRQLNHDASLRSGGTMIWAELLPTSQIPQLKARMRERGYPNFRVHPTPIAKTVLPFTFLYPEQDGNRRGLGFDMLSEPARRSAVEQAIRSMQPTATGPIELKAAVDGDTREGFAIMMPVFSETNPQQLVGVVARGFSSKSFLEAALEQERGAGYGVALYDGESATRTLMAASGPQRPERQRLVRIIELAHHPVRLEISPPLGSTLSNLSLLTLLFGMMVAALLLIVARLVTQQAAEDRAALAWFEEQASIRNSLTRELNHRVKNTLANVLSIVALTRRRTTNVDDFVTGLIGRVRALSATHDLLTQSEWGTTPIRSVIGAELAPYVQDADHAITLRGPHVELAPNDALSLGLAVHELATNASKYGALSIPGGHVGVSWEMITDKLARIDWSERGGPPVATERRRGFGTELIEKIVAHELKNPVELRFEQEGVSCTLVVPVRTPAAFQMRAPREAA